MKANLDPLKNLLTSFKAALTESIAIEKEIPIYVNQRDPITPWEKNEAYSWIFFDIDFPLFWGSTENTKKKKIDYPNDLLKKAKDFYDKWGMKTIDVHGCKASIAKIKQIYKYKRYIPEPYDSDNLMDYIIDLRELVTEETYSIKIWRESLFCFLEYVRANIQPECHGFIDHIFPADRAFFSDTIIRLVRKDKFPTNIIYVSQILKNLYEELLSGDKRAQHSAAETLAFSWLCLISSRLRLPTEIRLLYEFNSSSLKIKKNSTKSLFPKKYLLNVPTLFGHIPMEISKLQFKYFSSLLKINKNLGIINQFFKSSERTLRDAFDKAVNKLNLPSNHGEITFTTLTSWPTEALHHRTQIDNAKYKIKIDQKN